MRNITRFFYPLFIAGFLLPAFSCDFSFKGKPDEEEPVAWDAAQPLKEIYQDYFLMGNIVSPGDLNSKTRFDILKRHYNTATAENAMKPDAIAPSPQPAADTWVYRFTQADNLVKAVNDAGLKMHGHTLVWHQQTPTWLASNNGTPLDKDTALANLEKYVAEVTAHFKGKLISWDVVNEAFRDGSTDAADWKNCLRTDSPWYKAIGHEYIEKAFLAARKADPEAKLYYNDYALNSFQGNNKQRAVYNMVQDINRRHPGLIDGIGMQSHHHLNTTPESVEESIELFSSLGVDIAISEMDIQAAKASYNNLTNNWDDNAAQLQAQKYAAMFKIFKKHSSKISRVTFWGLDDQTSWRKDSCPTLLDKDYNLKPAFYAVMNPEKF